MISEDFNDSSTYFKPLPSIMIGGSSTTQTPVGSTQSSRGTTEGKSTSYSTPQYVRAVTTTPRGDSLPTTSTPTRGNVATTDMGSRGLTSSSSSSDNYAKSVVPNIAQFQTTPVQYNAPGGGAMDALIQKLSSMEYDKQYADLMSGNLRQSLMNTAASSRDELANRLADAGVEGGMAQDRLAGIDRAASQGMASGMAAIQQKAMEQAYSDRQAALSASLQKYGVDAETATAIAQIQAQKEMQTNQLNLDRELGMGNLSLEEKLGMGNLDLSKSQLELERELGLGNIDLKKSQLELDRELGLGNLDLGRTDRQIEIENLNQKYGLQTKEDQMNFALSLLQLAQYADTEESNRLMQLAWEMLNQPATTNG
jgi:hypothetical protein